MMKRNSSLRRWIVLRLCVMTFIICLLFVIGLFIAFEFNEEVIYEDHLEKDLNSFIQYYRLAPQVASIPSQNFDLYIEKNGDKSSFPVFLRDLQVDETKLAAGEMLEIEITEELEVRLVRDGDETFYFVIDETVIENFEWFVIVSVFIIIVVISMIAIMLSRVFANHLIRPVTDLANRVNSLEQTGAYSSRPPDGNDDEISVLSHAIAAFQKRVNELLERERDFSSDVSHELRTPLMGIQAAASNLLLNQARTERVLDLAGRIDSRCRQMNSLIDSMLFLARDPTSLENDFAEIDLLDVIHDQLDAASHHIDGKGIHIHIIENTRPRVFSSEAILSVVFGNLLRNALLHSESKDINIELNPDGFTIRDFGLGIPDELKDRMFERFASGVTGIEQGSGIGLGLVKRLCDHFEWVLSVQSRTGQGTTMSVNFGQSIS